MKIDFYRLDTWYELNEVLENQMGLQGRAANALAFKGMVQALWETTSGLMRLFPHRRKVFYARSTSPFLDLAAKALARDGLAVEGLTVEQLHQPESLPLDKDTLFIMVAVDDPLLGMTFDFPGLREKLESQRIFLIELSHARHNFQSAEKLGRFEAQILSIDSQLAVAVVGERVKLLAPMAEASDWDPSQAAVMAAQLAPRLHAREKIMAFEAMDHHGGAAILHPERRFWDRAVLAWQNLDGGALAAELAAVRPVPTGSIETASLTRWGGLRTMDWMAGFGLEPKQIRGCVIFAAELIDETLSKDVNTAVERVLALQSGRGG